MSDRLEPLDQAFFDRDARVVARDVLGRYLRRDQVVLRITEVEAYAGPSDTACHATAGRTARTAPLYGPAGRAYVYLCYGLHQMLNLVCGPDGHCVLVRACAPIEGHDIVQERRGAQRGTNLLTGPGRVGQALALDGSFSHHPLTEPGGLQALQGEPVTDALSGPRVGIDYALPRDREAPWRFAVPDCRWVSHRKGLAARR